MKSAGRIRQAGLGTVSALFILIALMIVAQYSLEALQTRSERNTGRRVAADLAITVRAWEVSMDAFCVSGSVPNSMSLSDLHLPSSIESNGYTFSYSPPPNAEIEVTIELGSISLAAAEMAIKSQFEEAGVGSQVGVSKSGQKIVVNAVRQSETSRTVFGRKRSSTDATDVTIMLQGTGQYNSTGC